MNTKLRSVIHPCMQLDPKSHASPQAGDLPSSGYVSGIINLDNRSIGKNTNLYVRDNTRVKNYNGETGIRAGIIVSPVSLLSVETASLTNGYNEQTLKYVSAINEKQTALNQSNRDFLSQKYSSGEKLNATALRNKADWTAVKKLVIRDELMKLQIGDVTDLPLSDSDIALLEKQIDGKDLANFSDSELEEIISSIMKPDEKACLAAFRNYKEHGIVSEYFQHGKLDQLSEYLDKIDLDKITAEQFKKLMDNFWEKMEVHHRTSISEDPTKQNDINNLDTLNTSEHDAKHTDPDTGKVNYKKPLKEEALDRQGELEKLNKKRVLKNEIKGLGAAIAIAAGTGFTIGFIISLAKTGISPNCLKHAFVAGGRASAESSGMAVVGYGLARTIGEGLSKTLKDVICSKLKISAVETIENIGKMCSMGVVGSLIIVVSSVYQFIKYKKAGYNTKECLIRTGKSAALSAGMLALAIAAQGIWGGPAGLIVSITAGIIMTGVSVAGILHDKEIRRRIQIYLIELNYPQRFSFA